MAPWTSIFKGSFNSNYRPDEWDFSFQLNQFSSIQNCQILPRSAIQFSALCFVEMQATQQERKQKTHFLGSRQSLGTIFVQHLAQQGPFPYARLLDAHFKVSIFEIWLSRALSIPSHICYWDFGLQDWRWSSSLCCRKWCQTVKIAMLNSCRTWHNFSSAAEFHWVGIQDESPGLGQASHVHFLSPEMWMALISLGEKLYLLYI